MCRGLDKPEATMTGGPLNAAGDTDWAQAGTTPATNSAVLATVATIHLRSMTYLLALRHSQGLL
jgi:hypothetical protein